MTGPEIVGTANAAAGAAKAVGKALNATDAETERLGRLAESTPAMERAAGAYAERLEIKQKVLLRLFQPLRRFAGIRDEYFAGEFGAELAKRVEGIPEESLQTPIASIAVPTMQNLGFSLDEPDLKEMYLNLLATATDGRREGVAHPSFSEIIKQLSASEARVFLDVVAQCPIPMIQVRFESHANQGYSVLYPYVLGLREVLDKDGDGWFGPAALADWIDNWERLGLITARFDVSLVRDSAYTWCDDHPAMVAARGVEIEGESPKFTKGILDLTSFGRRFVGAVSPAATDGFPSLILADDEGHLMADNHETADEQASSI